MGSAAVHAPSEPAFAFSPAAVAELAAAAAAEAEVEQLSAAQRAQHESELLQLTESLRQERDAWDRQYGEPLRAVRLAKDSKCRDGVSEKLEAKTGETLRLPFIDSCSTGAGCRHDAPVAELRLERRQQAAVRCLQEGSTVLQQERDSRALDQSPEAVEREQHLQLRQARQKAEQQRARAALEQAGAERLQRLLARTEMPGLPSLLQQRLTEEEFEIKMLDE